MFLDELTPIFREITQQPVAFLGGFFAGMFKLKLTDEPINSWLDQQIGVSTYASPGTDGNNGKSSGPQSINID